MSRNAGTSRLWQELDPSTTSSSPLSCSSHLAAGCKFAVTSSHR